jgi:3-deoxy-D-manno-octulosonic-acid transferase
MMWLYSVALAVGLVVSSPWWIMRMLTTERYREGMRERLGSVPQRLRDAVAKFAEQRRVVWVHAVSVGEVLAASRLVGELEAALSKASGVEWRAVVSTTTRTGQALARERFGAERVFYFPLDFAWAVRAYLRVLNPAALVLMESELWPRMLHECRRASVPVVVVNARVSDRSFARGMKVRAAWGHVLRRVPLWLAQSEEDARRLVAMGARPENVRAIGNLKYDVRAPKESRVAELIKEAAAGRPIVVAGSTVSDRADDEWEDDLAILAWTGKIALDHRALLVVAPRHPERFSRAEGLAMPYRYVRASDWSNASGKTFPREGDATWNDQYDELEIVVLDTIGDLAAVYGIADIAFVGGSLVKRGGHNPLEPAQFAVPVVMGPSFENFRDVVTKMQAADAIRIVGATGTAGLSASSSRKREDFRRDDKDEASRDRGEVMSDELERTFIELLTNRDAARAMGERGRKVFEEQQGATGRAVEAIVAMIHTGAKP